jgi:hypothetical protein
MRLEQLYKNFGLASPEEQAEFISAYRFKRASDLSSSSTVQKKQLTTSNTSTSKLALSEEEKLLMKMLGIKQKDIIAMRQVSLTEVESSENESDLLKDSTFDEGDE